MAKETRTSSSEEAPSDTRMLYVLGFGLAGAVIANVLIFVYFARFFAAG